MTSGKMSGAGLMVTACVCIAALIAVAATAYRFAATGDLDAAAVSWSTGLVGVAAALLAKTYHSEAPAGTPADPVSVTPADEAPAAPEEGARVPGRIVLRDPQREVRPL